MCLFDKLSCDCVACPPETIYNCHENYYLEKGFSDSNFPFIEFVLFEEFCLILLKTIHIINYSYKDLY